MINLNYMFLSAVKKTVSRKVLKYFGKIVSIALAIIFLLFGFPDSVFAGITYDMATTSNWNIRIEGADVADKLGRFDNIAVGDIDSDGIQDIVVGAERDDNNSRTDSGSVFYINGTLFSSLTGTGNTIDLSDPSKYTIRWDGAVADDRFGAFKVFIADIDNDDKPDIIANAGLADNNTRSASGSLYVIFNTLIDDYSGTGNNVDMATSTNYNLRYDGPALNDQIGIYSNSADLDNNGKEDLIIVSNKTDYNSNSNSGSAWIIYDSLIDDYSGTGNNIDLGTATNYNLRYDGANDEDIIGDPDVNTADVDNDGKLDLMIGSTMHVADSRTGSGAVWIIYNTLIDDYAGTGNNLPLYDANNYNLKFYGAATEKTSVPPTVGGDFDGDGKLDLLIGSHMAINGSNAVGAVYLINGILIDDYIGTGNSIDLSTTSNFNVRIYGSALNSTFSHHHAAFLDFDDDSKLDIVAASLDSNNSRAYSGSLYVFYNALFSALSGTGNTLYSATDYSLRYDGATDYFTFSSYDTMRFVDMNSDGKYDQVSGGAYLYALDGSGRDQGFVYIIYNFPHTISVDVFSSSTNDSTPTFTGTISATNSTTNISGVEYQEDSNSPTGSWTACTADDGTFNSTSESFTCTVSSALSEGAHTVYFRAYDSNISYTDQSYYASKTFTVDLAAPSSVAQISPVGYSKDNSKPTLVFRKSPDLGSVASYSVTLDSGKNNNYSVSGIPSAGNGSANYFWRNDSDIRVEFTNENDSDSGNDEIRVYFKGLDNSELTEGKHKWSVTTYDANGNFVINTAEFYLDFTNPSISDLAISDIAMVSPGKAYKLDISQRMPSFIGTSHDIYQGSTKTNNNGTIDVFDKVASGPDKITLTVKRLKDGADIYSPLTSYQNYFSKEFFLTEIQDKTDVEKYFGFFISSPYPLIDGYYLVNLTLTDKAGNTYSYPAFYLSLNYWKLSLLVDEKTSAGSAVSEKKNQAEVIIETQEGQGGGYNVQVKVIDQKQTPIQGAKVAMHSKVQKTVTDSQGIAKFSNVEAGEHKIVINYKNLEGELDVNLTGDVREFHYILEVRPKIPLFLILFMIAVVLFNLFLIWLKRKKEKKESDKKHLSGEI